MTQVIERPEATSQPAVSPVTVWAPAQNKVIGWALWLLWPLGVRSEKVAALVLFLTLMAVAAAIQGAWWAIN